MQPRAALDRAAGQQPAALERLDRAVAWDEHARAGRTLGRLRRQAVAQQRLELERAVLHLRLGGRDPERADAADDRAAQLGLEPVELGERLDVDADRPLLAPRVDGRVVEQRAAGEQEAAVAPGRPAGDRARVDADDARARLERRADRGEPRAAEPDHADVGGRIALQRRGIVPGGGVAPDGRRGGVTAPDRCQVSG